MNNAQSIWYDFIEYCKPLNHWGVLIGFVVVGWVGGAIAAALASKPHKLDREAGMFSFRIPDRVIPRNRILWGNVSAVAMLIFSVAGVWLLKSGVGGLVGAFVCAVVIAAYAAMKTPLV